MKALRRSALSLLPLAALVAGCGDDEMSNPPPSQGTVNQATVNQVSTATFQALQTASQGDGSTAGFQLLGLGLSALGFVTPSSAQPFPGVVEPAAVGVDVVSLRAATCTCTANSCNFDGCGDGSGLQMTGDMSWTNTSFDADYAVGGGYQGSTYSYSVFANLDYTPTSINGVVSTAGNFTVSGGGEGTQTSSWDTEMTFNQVTFSGGGQPTGGTVDVSATATYNGETYSANGTVTF